MYSWMSFIVVLFGYDGGGFVKHGKFYVEMWRVANHQDKRLRGVELNGNMD